LNGSVNQGTIGGVAYKELNKVPILGAGTDFTINADGYIASFLTDAGDPNLLEIPGGNWNFETYFSSSSSGGTPTFYVELYKYDGTTFTLIASSVTSPEFIAFGTTLTPYFSTLAVPTTTLALTDRLAVRYYVTHSGRTITLHTENNHLCQIITTFTTGLTALNGLTAQVQNFAVGTTGTDFNIASAVSTHTFNLPTASATNRGALSSADWALFTQAYNDKINSAAVTGTTTKTLTLTQQDGGTITASWSDLNTDAVLSVFGRTGNVIAVSGDYTTAQVTESGNLYYTDGRARASLSFAAGSGAYNTSTGVITIPTNNNQITNGAGYITSAALAGYLPLTGGTLTGPLGGTSISLSGDITANRYRGVNSLVINSYTTVNPSSNVYLYSPPNDRDAWIYLDSADTGSNWGIYHRQIDTAVSGLPPNSIGFIGGGSSILQAWISLQTGNGFFAGNLTAANLSGTNTGNVTIGTGNGLSLSGQALSLGLSSGSSNGALSSTDWTTFNSKQNALTNPVTGTGTTNYLPKFTGSTTIGDSAITDNGTTVSLLSRALSGTTATFNFGNFVGAGARFQFNSSNTPFVINALNNNGSAYIGWNVAAKSGSDTGTYILSQAATKIEGDGGSIRLYTAPSGTSGNDITFTEQMRLFSDGNLLLQSGGTFNNNGARLQVSGTSRLSGAVTINQTTSEPLRIERVVSGTTVGRYSLAISSVGNLSIYDANADSDRVTFLTSTGAATFSSSVTANTLLTVNTPASGSGVIFRHVSGTNNPGLFIETVESSRNVRLTASGSLVSGQLLQLGAEGNAGVLNIGGSNVGIGTPSPTHKLQVLGSSDSGIRLTDSSGNTRALLNPSGVQHGEFTLFNNSGNATTYLGGGGGSNYVMAQGGNFLIGTTTDNGAKLNVNGTVFIGNLASGTNAILDFATNASGGPRSIIYRAATAFLDFTNTAGSAVFQLSNGGAATFSSSVTASSFFESSDATLKTLLQDNYQAKGIDSVVAKLYIKNGKEEIGYFAQDLQDVLPSAVSKGSDGLLNLSYREVHTAKIAYLEEEIRQLKKKYENN
jgi:hypothetical protein